MVAFSRLHSHLVYFIQKHNFSRRLGIPGVILRIVLVGGISLRMPGIFIVIFVAFVLDKRLDFLNVKVILVQVLIPLFSVLGLLVREFAEFFLVYFLFEIGESQVKGFLLVGKHHFLVRVFHYDAVFALSTRRCGILLSERG